jgi:hypothetical protein
LGGSSDSLVDYDDKSIFKMPSEEEEVLLRLPAKRGASSFTSRRGGGEQEEEEECGNEEEEEEEEEAAAKLERSLFALAESFDEKKSPGIVRHSVTIDESGEIGGSDTPSTYEDTQYTYTDGGDGEPPPSPYKDHSASTTDFI